MRPRELADELGVDPKALRQWLRDTYPGGNGATGNAWVLTPDMIKAARRRFGNRTGKPRVAPPPTTTRHAATNASPDSSRTAGHGLHHPVMRLANDAGIDVVLGRAVNGLTTRGHAIDGIPLGPAAEATAVLAKIFDALGGDDVALRAKATKSIAPDLVHRPTGTLIEVDEEQHFTSARLTALRLYPRNSLLGFDLDEYIDITERWRAKGDRAFAHKTAREFPGRGGRQAQRAYLDAVRDLLAPHLTGHPVIRIAVPDRSLAPAVATLQRQLRRL